MTINKSADPAIHETLATEESSRLFMRRRFLQPAVQMRHLMRIRSNTAAREPIARMPPRVIDSKAASQPSYRILVRQKQTTRPKSKLQLVPPPICNEPAFGAILLAHPNPVDTRFSTSIPITQLLKLSQQGDVQAGDHLFRIVFGQLRRIAAANLRREHNACALQPTELVNEAYLRLFGNREKDFQNREHFFRVAARAMRCVLADIARKRNAAKRMDGLFQVPLDETIADSRRAWPEKVLIFEEALSKLAQMDPRAAEVVELKVFLGLTDQQAADSLGCSVRTVKRDFKAAKVWLQAEMGPVSPRGTADAT